MKDPLVSVIVPVYNVEAYLEECVASILAQTYGNLQIILVDDGSTDQSGGLCDAFAAKDGRVQVIHQENGGVSAARNAGLDAARGVYIYFVDGDDWTEATMVEETVSLMEAGGYDLCAWAMRVMEEGGEASYIGRWKDALFQIPTDAERRRFLCRWVLPCRIGWSVYCRAFRRDLIRDIRFDTGCALFEDLDFFIRCTARCRNLYYFPKALYTYRQRGGSAMHTNDLGAQARGLLRLLRREREALSDQALFRSFSVYTGAGLCVFLWNYTEGEEAGAALERFAADLRQSEDWDDLLEQAALGNRAEIRRACGVRLGSQVNGLFRYLLGGGASAYCRADRMQRCFLALRKWKNRALHGVRRGT